MFVKKNKVIKKASPKKVIKKEPFSFQAFFKKNTHVIVPAFISILLYYIVRSYFPIPDFTADSRMYIFGAITDSKLSYRPLGYSSFLSAVHNISPDIATVAFFQFLLFLASTIFFLQTFFSIFAVPKKLKAVVYFVCLVNFPFIFIANTIMTDSLFISLTMLWLTFLLRIITRYNLFSNIMMIAIFWGLLFIRFNALVYPVVAILALLFFVKQKAIKYVNISLIVLISVGFFFNMKNRVQEQTDTNIIAGFSGWQLASNAFNAVMHLKNCNLNDLNEETAIINDLCCRYKDSLQKTNRVKNEYDFGLLWNNNSPFKKYQHYYQAKNNITDEFEGWTKASIALNEYGWSIIRQYPSAYFLRYLVPNTVNYLNPDLEMLQSYQLPGIQILPVIREYYQLPVTVKNSNQNLPNDLNWLYKPLFFIVSVLFILMLVLLLIFYKKIKMAVFPKPVYNAAILLMGFYLLKMMFDVYAAPVAYRYIAMCFPLMASMLIYFVPVLLKKKV